ncbi:MAG: hypothetical protein Q4C63_04530 [Eubacteriales bacterium]|nr:hypothetical protein [Eubacteriales bacterium]
MDGVLLKAPLLISPQFKVRSFSAVEENTELPILPHWEISAFSSALQFEKALFPISPQSLIFKVSRPRNPLNAPFPIDPHSFIIIEVTVLFPDAAIFPKISPQRSISIVSGDKRLKKFSFILPQRSIIIVFAFLWEFKVYFGSSSSPTLITTFTA